MTQPAEISRDDYIGSSNAKDILDGNWRKLYREKKGLIEREDLSDKFNVQLGTYTEHFHLDWTIRRMIEAGEIALEIDHGRQKFAKPEGVNFVGAHIDALVGYESDSKSPIAPVEAKHSSGKRSMDELLEWYMPQVQHHLWCTGAAKGVVSVIQGNVEPERLWIGRSEDWLKVYGAACAKFWQHITNNSEPGTTSPGVIMPQAVIDAIPLNGRIRRCVDTDNMFIDRAHTLIDNEAAARSYESAKKDLKAMMGPDDGELYSEILTLKKDKRGAVRMTIHESRERSAA